MYFQININEYIDLFIFLKKSNFYDFKFLKINFQIFLN